MALVDQVATIYAANGGFLDEVPVDQVLRYEGQMHAFLRERYPDIVASIETDKAISKDIEERLRGALADFNGEFQNGATERPSMNANTPEAGPLDSGGMNGSAMNTTNSNTGAGVAPGTAGMAGTTGSGGITTGAAASSSTGGATASQ